MKTVKKIFVNPLLISGFVCVCAGVILGQESQMKDVRAGSVNGKNVAMRVNSLLNSSGNVENREKEKKLIQKYILSPYLNKYSNLLITELIDYEASEDSCIILGRLDIDDDLRRKLLWSNKTPAVVRARLGDAEAKKETISKFREAKTVAEIRKRCNDLLYVGGEEMNKVFAEGLQSSDVLTNANGIVVSKVQILIQCYSNVDPDEELLSSEELIEHNVEKEGEFMEKKHSAYIENIEKYFTERLGSEVNINIPFLRLGPTLIERVSPLEKEKGVIEEGVRVPEKGDSVHICTFRLILWSWT